MACLSLGQLGTASHAADQKQSSSFLQLSPEHRYWWVNGAILTTSHLVAVRDKKRGDCVAKWYLDDRAARQKLQTS